MNTKSKKNANGGWGLYLLFIGLIVLLWYNMTNTTQSTSISKAEFVNALELGEVEAVKISQNAEVPTGMLTAIMKDDSTRTMYVSDVNEIQTLMEEKQFYNFYCTNVPQKTWLDEMLPMLVMFGAFFLLFMIMNNNAAQQSGGSKMMNFGKSRAKLATNDKKATFENVAGLREEKEELEEIVDFLRSPKKYTELGARIPTGVLLVGTPGSG